MHAGLGSGPPSPPSRLRQSPASSPIADAVQGGEAGDQFTSRLVSSGQLLTQDRFAAALKARAWQCLMANETGDPSGLGLVQKPALSTGADTRRAWRIGPQRWDGSSRSGQPNRCASQSWLD